MGGDWRYWWNTNYWMIFHFLTLNCFSADSTDSMIFPFLISLGLKITEKIQVSLSNLCDDIPFNSSRALPILFGHPTQRNPSRTTIPSTSKVAVFISTPVLTQLNAMKDDSNKMFYIALLKSTHHPTANKYSIHHPATTMSTQDEWDTGFFRDQL